MDPSLNNVAAATYVGYITRQDIVNFPFPHKLWIVVHLENCEFLQWNRDGTVLLLDLAALDDYLNSTRTIFKIKNRSTFLNHLEEFKFQRLNANPEAGEDILLQYQNENFQRHRLDLLAKIRRHTYELIDDPSTSTVGDEEERKSAAGNKFSTFPVLAQEAAIKSPAAERMMGDFCFMFHGGLSSMQISRLRFQTSLHFQNVSRILLEKLCISDENAARVRRARMEQSIGRSSAAHDDEQLIEIPVELFENPHDSVLNLGEDFRPEYAGYYGNCSKETIVNFFGDYLPMYEDGTMDVRKVIALENSQSNNDPIICETNINTEPTYSLNMNACINIEPPSTTISSQNLNLTNLNFSSGLEPIFKCEDNQELAHTDNTSVVETNDNVIQLTNPNNFDIEAEISMEEFITFKDPLALSNADFVTNADEEKKETAHVENRVAVTTENAYAHLNINSSGESMEAERFPQMPAAVKMVIEEDPMENEANFRNFFSQYRASLNLLYERN